MEFLNLLIFSLYHASPPANIGKLLYVHSFLSYLNFNVFCPLHVTELSNILSIQKQLPEVLNVKFLKFLRTPF